MVKAPERCQGVCTIFKGGQEKKIRFIEPSKSCMTNEFRIIKMIRCLLGLFFVIYASFSGQTTF